MTEHLEVDFSTRKTEAEWQQALDRFWLAATPQWFELLEWLLVMAAVTYVDQVSESWVVSVTLGITYAALFLYLQSFFFRYRFTGLSKVSNAKVARSISLVISGALAVGTYLLLGSALKEVVAAGG